MCVRTPASVVLIALVLIGTASGSSAAGGTSVRITHLDALEYPTIRLTVVTPVPEARPPRVIENGTPAAGLDAENFASQASVTLAIDRSRSMRGRTIAQALAASRAFLASKPVGYRVSIVSFASQPLQLTPFSASTDEADSALRSTTIDPKAGTTVYDAVTLSAAALRSESSPGRVVILITDGQDTTSKATLRQAIAAARRARVILFPIAIKDASYTPRPLRALAGATGGRMFVAAPGESLMGDYRLIASQLRQTWQISYLTPVRPGGAIRLTAAAPRSGTATATITIPGSARSPTSGGALPFTALAFASAALIVLAIAAFAAKTIRSRSNFHRDLY